MLDRRMITSADSTVADEVDCEVDLTTLPCGGCGHIGIAGIVTRYRERGSRTFRTTRIAYCCECGRQSPRALSIEEFPVGGWAVMAEDLGAVPPRVTHIMARGGG